MRNYIFTWWLTIFKEFTHINFLFRPTKIPTSLEDRNDISLSIFILQSKLTSSRSYSSLMPKVWWVFFPVPILFLCYIIHFFLPHSYKLLSSQLVYKCELVSRETWWECRISLAQLLISRFDLWMNTLSFSLSSSLITL